MDDGGTALEEIRSDNTESGLMFCMCMFCVFEVAEADFFGRMISIRNSSLGTMEDVFQYQK